MSQMGLLVPTPRSGATPGASRRVAGLCRRCANRQEAVVISKAASEADVVARHRPNPFPGRAARLFQAPGRINFIVAVSG